MHPCCSLAGASLPGGCSAAACLLCPPLSVGRRRSGVCGAPNRQPLLCAAAHLPRAGRARRLGRRRRRRSARGGGGDARQPPPGRLAAELRRHVSAPGAARHGRPASRRGGGGGSHVRRGAAGARLDHVGARARGRRGTTPSTSPATRHTSRATTPRRRPPPGAASSPACRWMRTVRLLARCMLRVPVRPPPTVPHLSLSSPPAGNIQPGAAMQRFTRCRRLSRPCTVCFDEAGDMFVPHLGLQVIAPFLTACPPARVLAPTARDLLLP